MVRSTEDKSQKGKGRGPSIGGPFLCPLAQKQAKIVPNRCKYGFCAVIFGEKTDYITDVN
jgi:hypothetical protein